MATRTVVPCYDARRDVLYACVDGVRDTEAEPVAVDLFLLHDATTGEVVGVECLDFSRRGRDPDWLATVPETSVFLPSDDQRHPETLRAVLEFFWHDAQQSGAFGPERRLTPLAL